MSRDRSCPGSQFIKEPVPEDIPCRVCGTLVEIWSDEVQVSCPSCKSPLCRDVAPSCIDWCKYAEECVGTEMFLRFKGKAS